MKIPFIAIVRNNEIEFIRQTTDLDKEKDFLNYISLNLVNEVDFDYLMGRAETASSTHGVFRPWPDVELSFQIVWINVVA